MSGSVTQSPAPGTTARPAAHKIDWINKNLRVAFAGLPPPAPPPPSGRPISYAGMRDGRVIWDKMRKTVESQLRDLEGAIFKAVEEHNRDGAAQDSFHPLDVADGVKKLDHILETLDERLIETLDKALKAEGQERARLQQEARTLLAGYRTFAQTNPTVAMIDKNGFAQTMIKSWIDSALADIAEKF